MKKNITLALCAMLCISTFLPACKKKEENEPTTRPGTVTVGALLSLTGNWSTLGLTSQAAINIALDDINAHLSRTNSSRQFAITVYDTELDADRALRYMNEAKDNGIRFVLGPQSSAEAAAVKPFADENDMLVVSNGSTAGRLSIANDNLFRFCPADDVEGAAMARTIYSSGVRALVTIARNDAGNIGLQTATGAAFTGHGGTIAALDPYKITTSDFSIVIADIKRMINRLSSSHRMEAIGVYLAAFDECTDLFRQAAGDPLLSSVKWYGGDGAALSAALINDAQAAEFAVQTRFFAPTFGLPEGARAKWEPLADRIKARTGIEPDAFALATYDALWVIALAYEAADNESNTPNPNGPTFRQLKDAFPKQANDYEGATGNTRLNAAGDRETGSFDYWGVVHENGAYKWKLRGRAG